MRASRQAKKASQLGRVFAVYRGNAPEFIQETARRFTAYNYAHGVHWKTPVPAEVRARIRTELGNEMFVREHGRAPLDDRERGSFMAQATGQQTTAVAGYDLTFTPVKSVSTLWALADRDVAEQIQDAHHAAVESTLTWLEDEVLFTRRGRGGIQQVKATGLIAGMFTHRDARSADPHLHTHVAVSNKVQDLDGHWLAVDGRVLYKANVTLSEMYNTLLEAELVARLGVRFENRPSLSSGPNKSVGTAGDKRPVREIVGVDERLAKAWSKRDSAIEARRRDARGRLPGRARPPADPWRGRHFEGTGVGADPAGQARAPLAGRPARRLAWPRPPPFWAASKPSGTWSRPASDTPRTPRTSPTSGSPRPRSSVVERVAEDRATWQVWHLRAEAQRQARAHGIRLADLDDRRRPRRRRRDRRPFHRLQRPRPAHPRDRGGRAGGDDSRSPAAHRHAVLTGVEVVSVYSLAGARQYTSQAVIDAERRIVEAARRTGGRTISEVRVGIAIAEAAANGTLAAQRRPAVPGPGDGHQRPRRPARARTRRHRQDHRHAVLTRAWQDSGGTVIGLAPSAVAAQELGASINPASLNAANGDPGADNQDTGQRRDRGARRNWAARRSAPTPWPSSCGTPARPRRRRGPSWMEKIDHKTLVLIDEAGMAATTDLAAAIDYITSRGGQVRLVGDDRQLASVAAGGVLRDIAHQVGAVTLSEVHRFRNPDGSLNHAEAAATLALREGDPSAIAFYADRGRIHVGDLGACADQAYAAWATDRASGDRLRLDPDRTHPRPRRRAQHPRPQRPPRRPRRAGDRAAS